MKNHRTIGSYWDSPSQDKVVVGDFANGIVIYSPQVEKAITIIEQAFVHESFHTGERSQAEDPAVLALLRYLKDKFEITA